MRHFPLVVLLIGATLTSACGRTPPRADVGTSAMAGRLAELAEGMDPRFNFLVPGQRVAHLRSLPTPPDRRGRLEADLLVATALLMDGDTEAAIEALEDVRDVAETDWRLVDDDFRDFVDRMIAISWMRLGEQRNCVTGHQPESCILPIRGTGVHTDPDPAGQAYDAYLGILDREPDDLEARWLLNIAAMALERWPEAVPRRWLVPPSTFESEYPLPAFPDVAMKVGLDDVGLSGGVVIDDLDGDGDLDVFVTSWGPLDPPRVFRNDGNDTFVDVSSTSGLSGITGGLNVVHGDYDNDGLPDLMVLRGAWLGPSGHHPDSLLHNDGAFHFSDVTESARLLYEAPTQSAAWGDFDNDGLLDLAMAFESSPGDTVPCRLYRNQGDGTFVDVAPQTGADVVGFVKAVVWGDVDNDGLLDLFFSRLGQPNVLLRNEGSVGGRSTFSDITATAGVEQPINAFPSWFFDYDNDGRLDLFVFAYDAESRFAAQPEEAVEEILGYPSSAERLRLYRNLGDGVFEDVSASMGLDAVLFTMGCNFGDLDNDGWLDFYAGTGAPDYRFLLPNRMFRNDHGRVFQDVTTAGGFGHLQKGHGVAFADLDNDGDQDVYAVMGGAYAGDVFQNVLFANPGTNHRWITLRLQGVESNRSAIGARIAVTVGAESGRQRTIHRVVSSGGSFGGSSLQQEIGLGDAISLDEVAIRWPSGHRQTLKDLPMGSILVIREDSDSPVVLDLPVGDLFGLSERPVEESTHHHEH